MGFLLYKMPKELRELLGHSKNNSEPADEVDITESFFKECEGLASGEVVLMPGFRLSDAMSAVELMDPKMDIGIHRYQRTLSVESLASEGYFENVTDSEVLAIVDATLCCLTSYLNGGNISNTLYTNVLLFSPQITIPHPVLDCLAKTFSHIVPLVRSIISTAMVYEEEDFNGTLPYFVPIVLEREELLKTMRNVEQALLKDAKPGSVQFVIATRFIWMRLFLELMGAMVPPMRHDDDALDGKGFRPNLEYAHTVILHMVQFIPAAETAVLGAKKLDDTGKELGFEADGKFDWLRVFDPDFNKMYLTGSFPRATIIPSRENGLKHFHGITHRLKYVALEMRNYLETFESVRDLLKGMCDSESCVLARSILQLTLIPFDDKVLGEFHLSELVEKSIQNFTQALVVREGSSANQDPACVGNFNEFVDDFSKVALTIVAHYGMNPARQREKLVNVIDEVMQSMRFSDLVDERTKQVHNPNNPVDNESSALPLYHYVYDTLISLIENHIELTLDLELLSPHEYASTFWFYGEVVMRWPISALQQFQEVKDMKNKSKDGQSNSNGHEGRTRYDRIAHRLLLMHARKNICSGVVFASYALTKIGVIVVRKWDDDSEKLRYEQRMHAFKATPFYHDYESYVTESSVFEYMEMPPADLWKRAIEMFELARNQFQRIEELYRGTRVPLDVVRNLNYVCKSNSVACRVLSAGGGRDRTIQWAFNKTKTPTFPCLKIS